MFILCYAALSKEGMKMRRDESYVSQMKNDITDHSLN